MGESLGKKFESKFKSDFLNTVPNSTIDRLYDSMSGYVSISNISDFIGYSYPLIMYLECKSHKGNTFPLSNLTQYDKLKEKVGIHGVRAGVILWFTEHDRVLYVPISTITKLKEDGKKSVNIKSIVEDGYKVYEIPSKKKRVFLDSNYEILLTTLDGE